jgi:hypothetical protein
MVAESIRCGVCDVKLERLKSGLWQCRLQTDFEDHARADYICLQSPATSEKKLHRHRPQEACNDIISEGYRKEQEMKA